MIRPRKMSIELLLWFSLALLAPLALLTFLTLSSLQTRTELAQSVASETQQALIQDYQDFFRKRFLPAYKDSVRKSLRDFPRDFHTYDAVSAARLYRQVFFPAMGMKAPSKSEEVQRPLRLQFKSMLLRPELMSVFDWLYALRNKVGRSPAAEVVEDQLQRFGCISRFEGFQKSDPAGFTELYSNCSAQLKPALRGLEPEPAFERFLKARKQRRDWQGALIELLSVSDPDVRAGIVADLSEAAWPVWVDPSAKEDFFEQVSDADRFSSQTAGYLELFSPYEVQYHSIYRLKLQQGAIDSGLHVDPTDIGEGHWLLSGVAEGRLEDQKYWATFNNAFMKVIDSMMLGDIAMTEKDANFFAYLGLSLDMEERPWRTWETNQGVFLFCNDYHPLDFSPRRYLAGLEPQPTGVFVSFIGLKAMQELFLDAIIQISSDMRDLDTEAFLEKAHVFNGVTMDFRQCSKQVRKVWLDLFELASGRAAKTQLEQESLGVLEQLQEGIAYFLGLRRDNPWLLSRSLDWQIQSYLAVEPIQNMRGDRGEISTRSLARQRLTPGMPGSPLERLRSMVQEGGFGGVEYRYEVQGTAWLVRAQRSTVFPSRVLFLQLSESLATRELVVLRVILSAVLLLTLTVTLFLGRRLWARIVVPVLRLKSIVSSYRPGEVVPSVATDYEDEIASMATGFEKMVRRINARVEETLAIQKLNELLLNGDHLETVMEVAARELGKASGADSAYLVFFEQTSREKVVARGLYERNCSDSQKEAEKLADYRQTAATVESTGMLQHRPEATYAYRIHQEAKQQEEAVQGVLLLTGGRIEYSLPPESLAFVRGYLSQTMTVIAKAWLDKIREDNVSGRDIQLGLLPQTPPECRGLEVAFSFDAARFLGGDFFDFLEFEEPHQLGMVISDVSGKGIGPSLFGTTSKAFLQSLRDFDADPGDLLTRTNDLLCEEKANNLFATVFLALVHGESREVRFASAGHNKMFWYQCREKKIVELSAKGLPLGMFSPGVYLSDQFRAEPGDWLFLYTDGIPELENVDLELYGMQRLEQFLLERFDSQTPAELIAAMREELVQFREGVDPSDDITYIAAKFSEDICKIADS